MKSIIDKIDFTGVNPLYKVTDEQREINPEVCRVLTLDYGVFYSNSVTILNNKTQRYLVRGTDYRLINPNHQANRLTGKECCSYIEIIAKNVESVSISYQFVGGEFLSGLHLLKRLKEIYPDGIATKFHWDNIGNKPDYFTPKEHDLFAKSTYGYDGVVDSLKAMVGGYGSTTMDKVLTSVLSQVDTFAQALDDLIIKDDEEINRTLDELKVQDGEYIFTDSEENPAISRGYGTWIKVTNTVLKGRNGEKNWLLGDGVVLKYGDEQPVRFCYVWKNIGDNLEDRIELTVANKVGMNQKTFYAGDVIEVNLRAFGFANNSKIPYVVLDNVTNEKVNDDLIDKPIGYFTVDEDGNSSIELVAKNSLRMNFRIQLLNNKNFFDTFTVEPDSTTKQFSVVFARDMLGKNVITQASEGETFYAVFRFTNYNVGDILILNWEYGNVESADIETTLPNFITVTSSFNNAIPITIKHQPTINLTRKLVLVAEDKDYAYFNSDAISIDILEIDTFDRIDVWFTKVNDVGDETRFLEISEGEYFNILFEGSPNSTYNLSYNTTLLLSEFSGLEPVIQTDGEGRAKLSCRSTGNRKFNDGVNYLQVNVSNRNGVVINKERLFIRDVKSEFLPTITFFKEDGSGGWVEVTEVMEGERIKYIITTGLHEGLVVNANINISSPKLAERNISISKAFTHENVEGVLETIKDFDPSVDTPTKSLSLEIREDGRLISRKEITIGEYGKLNITAGWSSTRDELTPVDNIDEASGGLPNSIYFFIRNDTPNLYTVGNYDIEIDSSSNTNLVSEMDRVNKNVTTTTIYNLHHNTGKVDANVFTVTLYVNVTHPVNQRVLIGRYSFRVNDTDTGIIGTLEKFIGDKQILNANIDISGVEGGWLKRRSKVTPDIDYLTLPTGSRYKYVFTNENLTHPYSLDIHEKQGAKERRTTLDFPVYDGVNIVRKEYYSYPNFLLDGRKNTGEYQATEYNSEVITFTQRLNQKVIWTHSDEMITKSTSIKLTYSVYIDEDLTIGLTTDNLQNNMRIYFKIASVGDFSPFVHDEFIISVLRSEKLEFDSPIIYRGNGKDFNNIDTNYAVFSVVISGLRFGMTSAERPYFTLVCHDVSYVDESKRDDIDEYTSDENCINVPVTTDVIRIGIGNRTLTATMTSSLESLPENEEITFDVDLTGCLGGEVFYLEGVASTINGLDNFKVKPFGIEKVNVTNSNRFTFSVNGISDNFYGLNDDFSGYVDVNLRMKGSETIYAQKRISFVKSERPDFVLKLNGVEGDRFTDDLVRKKHRLTVESLNHQPPGTQIRIRNEGGTDWLWFDNKGLVADVDKNETILKNNAGELTGIDFWISKAYGSEVNNVTKFVIEFSFNNVIYETKQMVLEPNILNLLPYKPTPKIYSTPEKKDVYLDTDWNERTILLTGYDNKIVLTAHDDEKIIRQNFDLDYVNTDNITTTVLSNQQILGKNEYVVTAPTGFEKTNKWGNHHSGFNIVIKINSVDEVFDDFEKNFTKPTGDVKNLFWISGRHFFNDLAFLPVPINFLFKRSLQPVHVINDIWTYHLVRTVDTTDDNIEEERKVIFQLNYSTVSLLYKEKYRWFNIEIFYNDVLISEATFKNLAMVSKEDFYGFNIEHKTSPVVEGLFKYSTILTPPFFNDNTDGVDKRLNGQIKFVVKSLDIPLSVEKVLNVVVPSNKEWDIVWFSSNLDAKKYSDPGTMVDKRLISGRQYRVFVELENILGNGRTVEFRNKSGGSSIFVNLTPVTETMGYSPRVKYSGIINIPRNDSREYEVFDFFFDTTNPYTVSNQEADSIFSVDDISTIMFYKKPRSELTAEDYTVVSGIKNGKYEDITLFNLQSGFLFPYGGENKVEFISATLKMSYPWSRIGRLEIHDNVLTANVNIINPINDFGRGINLTVQPHPLWVTEKGELRLVQRDIATGITKIAKINVFISPTYTPTIKSSTVLDARIYTIDSSNNRTYFETFPRSVNVYTRVYFDIHFRHRTDVSTMPIETSNTFGISFNKIVKGGQLVENTLNNVHIYRNTHRVIGDSGYINVYGSVDFYPETGNFTNTGQYSGNTINHFYFGTVNNKYFTFQDLKVLKE